MNQILLLDPTELYFLRILFVVVLNAVFTFYMINCLKVTKIQKYCVTFILCVHALVKRYHGDVSAMILDILIVW